MYYELNVSKNGKHVFATAKRSLQTFKQAAELAEQFKKAFSWDEGYIITCTLYQETGTVVEV